MAEKYGTYHLADNPDLYEIQRSNNFEFQVGFDVAGKILKSGVTTRAAEDFLDGATSQEYLRLAVTKASIPNFSQDIITIKRGNSVMKAAGLPTFSEGTLVVNDFIGADIKSILMAWQRLSYDVTTEKIGKMSDYKFNCTLTEYTPNYEQVRYWDLKGCWISEISEDDFNQESGDKKQITAKIQYDYAIMHLPDVE